MTATAFAAGSTCLKHTVRQRTSKLFKKLNVLSNEKNDTMEIRHSNQLNKQKTKKKLIIIT